MPKRTVLALAALAAAGAVASLHAQGGDDARPRDMQRLQEDLQNLDEELRGLEAGAREELVALADFVEAVGENAEVWVADHWPEIRDRIRALRLP